MAKLRETDSTPAPIEDLLNAFDVLMRELKKVKASGNYLVHLYHLSGRDSIILDGQQALSVEELVAPPEPKRWASTTH